MLMDLLIVIMSFFHLKNSETFDHLYSFSVFCTKWNKILKKKKKKFIPIKEFANNFSNLQARFSFFPDFQDDFTKCDNCFHFFDKMWKMFHFFWQNC